MDLCSLYIYIFAIWSSEQTLKRSHTPIEVPLVNKSHDSIHIVHNIKPGEERSMMRKNRGKSSSLGRLWPINYGN